jgi:hypothetical protein
LTYGLLFLEKTYYCTYSARLPVACRFLLSRVGVQTLGGLFVEKLHIGLHTDNGVVDE